MTAALRFAHISDLHFGSRPRLRQLGPRRLLGWINWLCWRRYCHKPEALVSAVAEFLSSPPDAVLVSGDIAQLGLPQEIEAACRILQPLRDSGIPVFMVRGNHDVYDNDPEAKAVWDKKAEAFCLGFAPDEAGVVSFRDMEIILLEQAIPTSHLFSAGELGKERCRRLAQRLAATPPDGGRVALGHYPLRLPHGRRLPWGYRLRDDRALEALLQTARCRIYCCGHVHQPYDLALTDGCRQCCAGSLTSTGKVCRFILQPDSVAEWG